MRKKGLLGLAGLLIVILLLLPLLDGIIVKEKLNTMLHTFRQRRMQINLVNYHLGWLHSTAVVSVKIPERRWATRILIDIRQGPLLIDLQHPALTRWAWTLFDTKALPASANVKPMLASQALVKARAYWHFNHRIVGSWQTFSIEQQENTRGIAIHWPGMQGNFQYLLNKQQWIFHGIVGGLSANWANNHVFITPLIFSMEGQTYLHSNWLGDMQLHIPSIIWQQQGEDKLVIQAVNIETQHRAGTVNLRLDERNKIHIQQWSYRDHHYAPSDFSFSGKNLTPTALMLRRYLIAQWGQQILRQHALFKPRAWIDLSQRLVDDYKIILAQGGSINAQAKLETSFGLSQLSFTAKRAIQAKATGALMLQAHLQLPQSLAKLLLYRGYRGLPTRITAANPSLTTEELTDRLLHRYQAMNLIVAQDDNYLSDLYYKNNDLKINGISRGIDILKHLPLEPGPVIFNKPKLK